jgi:putative peptidoglycan lipid II flippase
LNDAAPRGVSLRKTMSQVMPVTFAAQICAFGASLALANVLGANVETDAYFLALSVPLTTYGILLAGVRLGAIPALTDRSRDGDASFSRSASEMVTGTALVALVLSVLLTAATLLAIPADHGLAAETRIAVIELAPLGVLGALAGALGAILATRESFIPAAAVLAFDPIARTILVVALGDSWGTNALVAGNLIGNSLAVVVLWAVLRRRGLLIRPIRVRRESPVIREVMKLSVPLMVGQSVLQLNPVIDRSMAANLSSGSVTQLELGLRLFAFPMTILTSTLIGPLAATWSARKLDGGWAALRESLTGGIFALTLVVPPILVSGLLLKDEAMTLLYSGGAYTDRALHETAKVFALFLVGFPAQLLVVLVATLFVVARDTVFPMKVALANVVLNVGLNFVLRGPLGPAGIALSTTVTFVILVTVYVVAAERRWKCFDWARLRDPVARAVASVAAGGAAGFALLNLADFPSGRPAAVAAIASVGAVAVTIHLLLFHSSAHAGAAALLRGAQSRRRIGV